MHPEATAETLEREARLDEVIGAYLQALAAGQAPDERRLLAQHPDLAPELAQFLADQKEVGRLAAPLRRTRPAGTSTGISTSSARTVAASEAAWRPAERAAAVLGEYELLGEIGRGGMGVVYKARHRKLGRLVAIKMIQAYAGPEARARFRTEAQAAARLQHPNIVQIFEVGEEDGRPYIVLEFVEGGSLAQHAGGDPLPAADAARLVQTLARAMQAAHDRGVVHRDLKPANILLQKSEVRGQRSEVRGQGSDGGRPAKGGSPSDLRPLTSDLWPKITDFGLAKQLDDEGGLTESGAIVGTPSYMAPEQAEGRGREVGPATDVYALGVLLYELLTGRPPFKGASRLETLQQVASEQPVPPRRLLPSLPRDLETVCLKCLQKEPHKRYPSAVALAEDLGRFLADRPVRARPAGRCERLWRWCRRQPVLAGLSAALALSVVVGFSVVTWQWRRAERLRTETERHLGEARWQRGRAEANFAEAERLRKETERHLAAVQRERTRAEKHLEEARENFRLAHEAVRDLAMRVSEKELPGVPGLQPLRKDLLEAARRYYQTFLERHRQDPALKADLADATARLAHITGVIGSQDDALAAYRQALALYEELLRADPDNVEHQVHRASIHNSMGILHNKLGKLKEALASFRQSRDLGEQALRARPHDRRLLGDLSSAHNNIGTIHAITNQPTLALGAFEQARVILEQLVRERPGDRDFQSKLGNTLNNLGVLKGRLGEPGPSLEYLQKSGKIRKELADRFPRVLEYQSAWAESCRNIGARQRENRQPHRALETMHQGREILERLVDANPRVTHYRNQLAAAWAEIGMAHLDLKEGKDALAAFDRARQIHEDLARRHPTVPYYQSEVGLHYFHLAQANFLLKRRDEELRCYERARDAELRLVQTYPDYPEYRHSLGKTLHNLGLTLEQLGRPKDALVPLRQAVEHQRVAVKAAPDEAGYRRSLSAHYYVLAEVQRKLGLLEEAADATRERQKLWPKHPGELYGAARDFARIARAAKDEAARDRYAALALDALRRAVAAGFKDLPRLRDDKDLDALRGSEEYKRLIADLAGKAGPGSEQRDP